MVNLGNYFRSAAGRGRFIQNTIININVKKWHLNFSGGIRMGNKLENILGKTSNTVDEERRNPAEWEDPWSIPSWDPSFLKEYIMGKKTDLSPEPYLEESPEKSLEHNACATSPGFSKFRAEAANTALVKDIYYSSVGDKVKPSEQHVKERDRLASYFQYSTAPCLSKAQASLARAGYAVDKTGQGFLTVSAITNLQQAAGLLCTGMLDQETVRILEIITKAGLRREDIESLGRKVGNIPKE